MARPFASTLAEPGEIDIRPYTTSDHRQESGAILIGHRTRIFRHSREMGRVIGAEVSVGGGDLEAVIGRRSWWTRRFRVGQNGVDSARRRADSRQRAGRRARLDLRCVSHTDSETAVPVVCTLSDAIAASSGRGALAVSTAGQFSVPPHAARAVTIPPCRPSMDFDTSRPHRARSRPPAGNHQVRSSWCMASRSVRECGNRSWLSPIAAGASSPRNCVDSTAARHPVWPRQWTTSRVT